MSTAEVDGSPMPMRAAPSGKVAHHTTVANLASRPERVERRLDLRDEA